jgi:hypothetical protein
MGGGKENIEETSRTRLTRKDTRGHLISGAPSARLLFLPRLPSSLSLASLPGATVESIRRLQDWYAFHFSLHDYLDHVHTALLCASAL